MPDFPSRSIHLLPLLSCIALSGAFAADPQMDEIVIEVDGLPGGADEILIEDTTGQTPAVDEIVIDAGPADAPDEIVIDTGPAEASPAASAAVADTAQPAANDWPVTLRIEDVRAEYGAFTDADSEADSALYGKIEVSANWRANPQWELQLAARADAHDQHGDNDFSTLGADYGESYLRLHGERTRLTLGTQTVIWGRLDELPLADRVSTADLTRGVLDDLADRRRANPMLRAETLVGGGKLDLVWLVDFRAAELPDKDSVWYPINGTTGRILGIDPDDLPPAAVQGARIDARAPGGDGGFGMRFTRTHSFADIGMTLANTRQSTPYFRAAGPGRFEAVYPRSWAYGLDAAIDAAGATWRVEALYSSDNPVTRSDLSYTTTPAVAWGGGVEFHPGDGDTRVNLQLMGMQLIDAPRILDREEIYNVNGEIDIPFDRQRWRASLDFYVGLDQKDIYLNPEIAFLGAEPHEFYLAAHYFDGDDQTLSGFHEDHSSINLGWRAKF